MLSNFFVSLKNNCYGSKNMYLSFFHKPRTGMQLQLFSTWSRNRYTSLFHKPVD
jgi:hypothetical protein